MAVTHIQIHPGRVWPTQRARQGSTSTGIQPKILAGTRLTRGSGARRHLNAGRLSFAISVISAFTEIPFKKREPLLWPLPKGLEELVPGAQKLHQRRDRQPGYLRVPRCGRLEKAVQ